jgi:hypothetical protein
MKRSTIIIGTMLILGALFLSSCGVGQMIGGGGMMGYRGYNQTDQYQGQQDMEYFPAPSNESDRRLQELDQRYYEKFHYLEEQIRIKEQELSLLLNRSDPDINELRALNREIRELSMDLEEEELNYEIEARKMISESESAQGDRI